MDKDVTIIPVSAIIPTVDRAPVLMKTLVSVAAQEFQPAEIIIIDASDNNETKIVSDAVVDGLRSLIVFRKADEKGAAAQRNQGVKEVSNDFILFMDDDIILEPGCIKILWQFLNNHEDAGGVNAMVTNQQYLKPGKATRFMYKLLSGQNVESYAGKCIGPAWNLLPESRESNEPYNLVEWLNTTCTLYRKKAVPDPVFSNFFKGYSLMEDLALSLEVARKWKLYNAANAKIFHDSQPGSHKNSVLKRARMELLNRHYVMTNLMKKSRPKDHLKLLVFELWGITTSLKNMNGWKKLPATVAGKLSGFIKIIGSK